MENFTQLAPPGRDVAVLDEAHVGHINGALGTIEHGDTAARSKLSLKFKTLLAIVGPGLIVMVGDNDAGAFSTYGQAGQNFGTPARMDARPPHPGPLRLPGNGPAPRCGDRCRARSPDPRALRQVLGCIQRHRPLPLERAHHRHGVHWDLPRRLLSRSAQGPLGDRRHGCHRRRGEHGKLPALRAALSDARGRIAPAHPHRPHGAPADRPGRARLRRAAHPPRRSRCPR